MYAGVFYMAIKKTADKWSCIFAGFLYFMTISKI